MQAWLESGFYLNLVLLKLLCCVRCPEAQMIRTSVLDLMVGSQIMYIFYQPDLFTTTLLSADQSAHSAEEPSRVVGQVLVDHAAGGGK